MPLLTAYSHTNKIIDESSTYGYYLVAVATGEDTPPKWKVNVNEEKFRHVGMTYNAAVTCRNNYNAMDNTTASLYRDGEAGQYSVRIHQVTKTVVLEEEE